MPYWLQGEEVMLMRKRLALFFAVIFLLQIQPIAANANELVVAESKQLEIRLAVAANPSTLVDSLLLLAGDAESDIRLAAVKNPSATAEVKTIASLLK